jgi:hypothetical protein
MVHALLHSANKSQPIATQSQQEVIWRVLLAVVDKTDVTVTDHGTKRTVKESLTEEDINAAVKSFTAFVGLVPRLTNGLVKIEAKWVRVSEPLSSVSELPGAGFAPLASDVSSLIDEQDASGKYDSIAVYYKAGSLQNYWGATGKPTKRGTRVFAIRDAPAQQWKDDNSGEVFLHFWMRDVAAYFRSLGFADQIPPLDAGGGDTYGYRRSGKDGWCTYYLPLLNGLVPVEGELKGISTAMWQVGAPRHPNLKVTVKQK